MRKARKAEKAPIYLCGEVDLTCPFLVSKVERHSGIELYYCTEPSAVRWWEKNCKEKRTEILCCCTKRRERQRLRRLEDEEIFT